MSIIFSFSEWSHFRVSRIPNVFTSPTLADPRLSFLPGNGTVGPPTGAVRGRAVGVRRGGSQ